MRADPSRARVARPDVAGREAPFPSADPSSSDSELTVVDVLWTVAENWKLVAATLAAVLLGATAYVTMAAPTFHSDALVQVEDKSKTLPGLDDVQSMFSQKSPAETEIEIIRSRSLIGSVVDQLNMTIAASPVRVRFVGGAIARRHVGEDIAPPLLGLARFAWGGERIVVTRLEVPDEFLNQELRLVAGEGGRFELFDPEDRALVAGAVGVPAVAPAGKPAVTIFVRVLKGRPGTHFRVIKRRRADVIAAVQDDLQVQEKGKKTGIITISLDGKSPRDVADILDAVAQSYLRQNVERRSAEAAKMLEFLDDQLPTVKKNLDAAEAALNDYREKKKTVDLTHETEAMMQRAAEIEKASFELDLTRSELLQRFTDAHPALLSLKEKKQKLQAERAALEAKLRTLPEQELTTIRLMRDAKVASELYVLLLNRSEELRIAKSGTVGNVRILDPALEPFEPSSPRKVLVLGLALVGGLLAGIGLAYLKKAIDQGLKDPDEIEAKTGLPIYASVPHSEHEDRLARERTGAGPFQVLAVSDPTDLAIESLRSLRTSLQFALVEARNNIVTVGGPSPGVGKTFLSVNLAHVLAQAGKRVLLVDADLRKGKLHRFFGGHRGPGLSEIVAGQAPVEGVVRKTEAQGVAVITTGRLPPNPSELLGSKGFKSFLDQVSGAYDFVVIDAPPVLAVTDAAIVAAHAGVNLLVLRAGRHPPREIAAALKALGHAGAHVNGAVVNDVRASVGRYGRYAQNYHYHYEYRSNPDEGA
jgi:tyrosine-protein kinase Etk/Wzc